jgi:predicted dehydrogenase
MQQLKAGVIGLGVGEQHIDGFRRAGVEVIALCDLDAGKRAMARDKYPECAVLDSADALIDDPALDIISIASFDDHHAAQVVRALHAGKHVFCEKPLCVTAADLAAIRDALASNPELRLGTNTVLRMSPRFRELKRRIDVHDLGRVYYLEADYNYGRLYKLQEGWRGRIPDYSVMLGGGIHMVDLMLWLTGSRIVEVTALGNKICSEGYGFTTPDMVAALLRFDNGVVGKVSANFGCVFPHFHKVVVYGTAATFENDFGAARLYRSGDPAAQPERLESGYPGVRKGDLIPGFVDSVLGTGRAAIEEDEILHVVAVCLAIDRSCKEGRPMHVQQLTRKRSYA